MTGLFTAVLNMSITASYVVLAVIVIRFFIKKIPKIFSYVLWLPVLIRLIFPFSFNSKLSFLGFLNPGVQTSTGAMEYVRDNIGFMQKPVVDAGINGINNSINTVLPAATPMASANPMQIVIEIASIIWIAGIVVLLVFSIISYLKVIQNTKTATLVKENVFETDRIATPFVCGFIRPRIFIPAAMDEGELTYILAHERIHIKRLDYLIKPFAFFFVIIHWFNPLIWLSFVLMSKDMEMSCDESVVKQLGNGIKENYSKSLLSLSVKGSGMIMGSPLAFGESSAKSRIRNILTYKKPSFGITVVAIILTATLIAGFSTNPQNVKTLTSGIYSGYNIEALADSKTRYVGDISKDVALIDAMQLPSGIVRDTVELQTEKQPYGITINLVMKDSDSIEENGAISGDRFYRNSILLFCLIDNVDTINYRITDQTGKYKGAVYDFTFTRKMAEKLIGQDVRYFSANTDTIKNLIDKVTRLSFVSTQNQVADRIEKNIAVIMSSPMQSSNSGDYIKAHQNEYDDIIRMGDEALDYLLVQREKNTNGLRGQIIIQLCKDIKSNENNVQG